MWAKWQTLRAHYVTDDFFFSSWIYVLIGCLHRNIALIYASKQRDIHTFVHVRAKARICKCVKNRLQTHTRMPYKHVHGGRLLSLCQINSHFLSMVNKCFGGFPKGSLCVCVFMCARVHEHLTGLMGQPVTTKMAKQLVGQREINISWWGCCVCVCVSVCQCVFYMYLLNLQLDWELYTHLKTKN